MTAVKLESATTTKAVGEKQSDAPRGDSSIGRESFIQTRGMPVEVDEYTRESRQRVDGGPRTIRYSVKWKENRICGDIA